MQTHSPLPSPLPLGSRSSFLRTGNESFHSKLQEIDHEMIELEAARKASTYPPTSFGEREGFNHLTAGEHFWRNQQPFLETCGYQLRPRFHRDWIPSWFETKKDPAKCQDGQALKNPQIIDAIRVSDGTEVVLKQFLESNKQNELEVLRFLSTESLRINPRNHCVPVIEIINARYATGTLIVVMPKLQHLYHRQTKTVADVLEFFHQVIEGYEFLHGHAITHGDCSWKNILSSRDPKTCSGSNRNPLALIASIKSELRSKLVHRTSSTRYYLIDFGSSKRFRDEDVRLLSPPSKELLPEWQKGDPVAETNPFALDIFRIGQLFQTEFCDVYTNFKFLDNLIWDMTHPIPAKRPTIFQVARRFETETSRLSEEAKCRQLLNRNEHPLIHVLRGTRDLTRSVTHFRRRSTSRTPKIHITDYNPLVSDVEEQSAKPIAGPRKTKSLLRRVGIRRGSQTVIPCQRIISSSDLNKPLPLTPPEKLATYITKPVPGPITTQDKHSSTPHRQVSRKRVPGPSELEQPLQTPVEHHVRISIEHHVHRDSTIDTVTSPHHRRRTIRPDLINRDVRFASAMKTHGSSLRRRSHAHSYSS